jgi:predicted nuclease of predicted toxin-antitoxin system
VKLLVDNALSPALADELGAAGHDAVHVRHYGMQAESDRAVFDRAESEDRILVSADTDFGTLLATRRSTRPSLVLMHRIQERHPKQQAQLLISLLAQFASDLAAGCVLVIEESRIRIRTLPL